MKFWIDENIPKDVRNALEIFNKRLQYSQQASSR